MTRVLLVDDEPLVLLGMQGMLNWAALGYEVVGTARNGAEALRAVQEKQPDIVVSDIRMPVMDGFALAEACHKDGSALKNIRKYIDMVLNKQQLSAPGGKTSEKKSVLKKLEEAKAAQSQKKAEQKNHTQEL